MSFGDNNVRPEAVQPITVFAVLTAISATLILSYLVRMIRNRTLHVQERQARFALFTFSIALFDYLLLGFVLLFPWEPALGVLGLFGLVGFSQLIGRSERREGKVIIDERDRYIDLIASVGGLWAFWACLCIGWFICFVRLGPDAVVPLSISQIGVILPLGVVIIFSVRAAVTLIAYRRNSLAQAN